MHNTNVSFFIATAIALTSACATTVVSEPEPTQIPDPPAKTTLAQIQEGMDLRFLPESSNLAVTVIWNQGGESVESAAELTLASGGLHVSADEFGVVRVESLDLQLADLVISNEQLVSDIELVDISVHQDIAQDCDVNDWTEDASSVSTWMQTELALDWSMMRNGNTIPLGGQNLAELPIELELTSGEDGVTLSLDIDAEGTVWSWLGAVELRDLHLELKADELGPVE